DNDGWLDLAVHGAGPTRVLRNRGTRGWEDVSAALGLTLPGVRELLAADLDRDCDQDLLLALEDGSVRLLRNDGGN
ncbi:MAG TPA: hypothetical protein DCY13_10930, partial [Verrucomicrobiales bacterium]|nr:hypothetical protein [Verrucomicrobiales bacterium]